MKEPEANIKSEKHESANYHVNRRKKKEDSEKDCPENCGVLNMLARLLEDDLLSKSETNNQRLVFRYKIKIINSKSYSNENQVKKVYRTLKS